MQNIFEQINEKAPELEESDLDWVVPSLIEHYDSKMRYLAGHAYSLRSSDSGFDLAVRSFKEQSKAELRSALDSFLFKKEHWKRGVSLNAYLNVVIKRLSSKIYWNGSAAPKTKQFVCPLCKISKRKEYLEPDGEDLKCLHCSNQVKHLTELLKKKPSDAIKQRLRLHSHFASHSKRGVRCPGCMRFIPKSLKEDDFIVCPYSDCGEFGDVLDFLEMTHPASVVHRRQAYLDASMDTNDSTSSTFLSALESDSLDTNAYSILEAKFDITYKVDLIKEVIEAQKKTVKRSSSSSTQIQKLLMYDAMSEMVDEMPEDMVRYLCHRKHSSSEPLQAKIFQKYTLLLEDYLPFTMTKGNKKVEIMSLTAPELSLFTGISEYESKVGESGVIPNETEEEYIGSRKYKNHGPCFIGKLIAVTNLDTNKPLMNRVVEYTFSKIVTDVEPGTPVKVTHFRMPSHYEMKGMVFLQRIRRLLVDSIYFRLHQKKREIK